MPDKAWTAEAKQAVSEPVFVRVLDDVVTALTEAHVSFGVIGGIASTIWGSPTRTTRDIDVMVARKDVASVLSSLVAAGFDTDVPARDSTWLAKGYRNGVVIDIISSIGSVCFDDELAAHVVTKPYLGLLVSVVAAEDLLIMKVHCHTMKMPGYGSESVPIDVNYDRHWRDALAIIEATALDCDYLLKRSRLAPHAVLSLLAYAQALGLAVPDRACRMLARRLYSAGRG